MPVCHEHGKKKLHLLLLYSEARAEQAAAWKALNPCQDLEKNSKRHLELRRNFHQASVVEMLLNPGKWIFVTFPMTFENWNSTSLLGVKERRYLLRPRHELRAKKHSCRSSAPFQHTPGPWQKPQSLPVSPNLWLAQTPSHHTVASGLMLLGIHQFLPSLGGWVMICHDESHHFASFLAGKDRQIPWLNWPCPELTLQGETILHACGRCAWERAMFPWSFSAKLQLQAPEIAGMLRVRP